MEIWNEISVYILETFSNIMICVGGNDSSNGIDVNQFEETYDELLLSFIKSANRNCVIHICKVLPRGDVDVSSINSFI